jgi:membrane protease YdiL (CAAX protease family)
MITPLKDLRLFPGADVDNWSDIKFTAAAYLMIAAFGTVMLAALWLGKKSLRGRWLPIQRVRYIPWHGIDVILVFMITQTIPPLVFQALLQAGFFEWLYGVAADKAMREREICWSGLVAYPLTLGLIILGLRQFRMARISEMGLTAVRAAKNFAVGLAGWAILTPTALLILALAIVATPQEWHSWVEEHPVSRLTQQTVTPVDWVVVFLAVVILAPLLEELVFRGIILPWQLRAGW